MAGDANEFRIGSAASAAKRIVDGPVPFVGGDIFTLTSAGTKSKYPYQHDNGSDEKTIPKADFLHRVIVP